MIRCPQQNPKFWLEIRRIVMRKIINMFIKVALFQMNACSCNAKVQFDTLKTFQLHNHIEFSRSNLLASRIIVLK